MTEKEAIEIINDVTWKDFGRHPDFPEARDMAKAALEKQISKKPKKMNYKPLVDFGWEYACAICGCAVGENQHDDGEFTQKDDYCPNCGQAIDWSENNNG